MKRWQHRGEVLDSDEEDLELSNNSQSPEQPRKRQRLDESPAYSRSNHDVSSFSSDRAPPSNEDGPGHEGGGLERTVAVSETTKTADDGPPKSIGNSLLSGNDQALDDETWLQPKVVAGFGRKARSSRPASRNGSIAAAADQGLADTGSAQPEPSPKSTSEAGAAYDEHVLAGSSPETIASDHIKIDSPCGDLDDEDLQLEPPAPTEEPLFAPSSPMTSDDEGLPDLDNLFRRNDAHPKTPDAEPQDDSSVLSSSLSSPELPARSSQSTLPRVATSVQLPPALNKFASIEVHSDPPTSQGVGNLTAADPANARNSVNDKPDLVETNGRRSLRTRTEKQLHPYVYDRTIYQQQWKQRGLKPVRFVIEARSAHETQDHSYDTDESPTQERHQESSSIGPSSDVALASGSQSRPVNGRNISRNEDELPDIDTVLDRSLSRGVQNGHKRRKTLHPPRPGQLKSIRPQQPLRDSPPLQQDESSVPLSPPPTSSDSTRQRVGVTLPSGFRFPFGMTPAPLPTPQISSETRPSRTDAHNSDSDALPPKSRASTLHGAQTHAIAIDSSTESETEARSESKLQTDMVDDRRLRRERKRIRGVLPASWLRIDIRAQQKPSASPTRARRSSSTPAPRDRPSKGVAQRISKSSDTPSRSTLIDIGDSGDDDSASPPGSPQQELRQRRLYLDRDYHSTARGTVIDEHMEMDWVDPMLAGTSRQRRSEPNGRKRQPQIKNGLRRARTASNDFSEERAGIRFAHGRAARSRQAKQPRGARATRRKRSSRTSATPLSILDAPTCPDTTASAPQFVRLAQRQARRQAGLGRHSPSRKIIRLTTKTETEEATELLTAWREGTIVPRSIPELVGQKRKQDTQLTLQIPTPNDRAGFRLPLVDVTDQQNYQTRLPLPLRAGRPGTKVKSHFNITMGNPASRQTNLGSMLIAGRTGEGRPNDKPDDRTKPKSRFRVLPQDGRTRGAQLEALENAFDTEHRSVAFERCMNVFTEGIARPLHISRTHALPLDRFLDGSSPLLPPVAHTRIASPNLDLDLATSCQHQDSARQIKLAHRPRKHPARRLNAESREYRQPIEPLPEPISVEDEPVLATSNGPRAAVLRGLGLFGTRYATDFDIQPLGFGTHFHDSTFIGSGDLRAALQLRDRDLHTAVRGQLRVHIDDEVCEWGAWTEEVADGLAKVPRAVIKALQLMQHPDDSTSREAQIANATANIDHMLRSVVRYCSKVLAFLDPIDRRPCAQHLQRLIDELLDAVNGAEASSIDLLKVNARCYEYILVLASQACILAQHHHVPTDDLARAQGLKEKAAMRLSASLVRFMFNDLLAFYDDNRHSSKREAGIRDDCRGVSGIVILHHCLQYELSLTFWHVIKSTSAAQPQYLSSVQELDREWYRIYSLLPALEIDVVGKACPGSRLESTQQDWKIIKPLMDRIVELYPATSLASGTTVNAYFRATLTRCYHLISNWGWRQCEVILGTIFDFFARRMLAPLFKEETHGSAHFLADLENRPSLEIRLEDRSFSIFLKMLAMGLLNMQKFSVYTDKKVGSIAWRFVPNHSRSYQKDADVERSDLDALRNHHDLLCTLYFACPPGHRVRLDSVRNIVDHSLWHREACQISVRAWANLTSFRASTGEPAESLQQLLDWYQDIMAATMGQYRLARTEAEADFARAKATGAVGITDALLDSTIAKNQRHIAATLVDALAGLKRALLAARTLPVALQLLKGSLFWKPFVPFDAGERHLYGALTEALEVVRTAINVKNKLSAPPSSQPSSEESQDYGDLDALQELAGTETVGRSAESDVSGVLHDPLAQLMSNVFGADQTIDEHLLTNLVDVWVQLAAESVRFGSKSWSSYIEQYSAHSWHQLRDTDQKRKLTPYFVARTVEEAARTLEDDISYVLEAWLVCLVEREAMLKHQHRLTNALLNNFREHPLLDNVPFTVDSKVNKYDIPLHELRQRRLGLISSLLSNMRTHIEDLTYQRFNRQEAEVMYSDLLRAMMQAMKSNYRELQSTEHSMEWNVNLRGVYVDFVQQVVTFLHAASIVKVENFFTDSSVFPLPAGDPTYVVGRLKAYVPRLANVGAQKALAIAIQSISERAAVDGQQNYLVEQLVSAVDEGTELGSQTKPSLRHFMLTAILPAYIAQALSTASSWIVATPILEAYHKIVGGFPYVIRLEDDSSLNAVVDIVHVTLLALLEPLHFALERFGRLSLPHVQHILALVFGVGRSMLTLCGHLKRSKGLGESLLEALDNMRVIALEIRSHLITDEETWFAGLPHSVSSPSYDPWAETRHYAQTTLAKSFETEWWARDGRYVLTKHNVPNDVVVPLRNDEGDQTALLKAITQFVDSFEIVIDVSRRKRRGAARNAGSSMLEDIMV